ncbi:Retrovirus-related Pol polyprotein from transposon RE2 [Trichinella spiralis]|uniref:Retrovirus-related Pol polyprotein from transposon RE2 n=1 Tax=Trichinella spiralis TaxID=6334 RepID=A0ABR3KBT7_TRISP
MTSTPFPKVANRAKKQIELIPSDICGPMITATPSDHRYMMTFIDDYSRFTVVHLLKTKDEAVDRIKDYVATLHTKFGQRFWGEPVCTAAFLQNRLPSRSISKTPFELWTGNKPNVSHIRIFGSKAYCYIPKQKRRKWVNKAREGVIVGYGGITKGYRLLSPTTNEIWISHSGKIIEDYSHMKNESAVPKGAIERSREYDDIPKLLKKEDNVIIEDIFGPTQEELSGEVEPIKDGIEAPTLRRSRRINKGIQIERKLDGTFVIYQKNKIMQLLESCSMQEAKPVATPMETHYLSSLDEPSPALPDKTKYRCIIGSLLHISNVTRPDIALSVGLLCRKMETPTERDWKSAKRIIRYLAGTANAKLCLSSTNDLILRGHVDADWAAWSRYHRMVHEKADHSCLSTTEAEYVALAEASRELLWLRQLLNDFGVQTPDATTLYEDNQGYIRLVESDRFGERTKHINVRFHMVKDLREKGILEVKYCPSEEMIADNLTKPVCKQQIENFTKKVGLEDYGQENEKGCWGKHSPDL